jgi:hypothetical protein
VNKRISGRATSYGCDGLMILVTGPAGTLRVPKCDAVRLAGVCLAAQGKRGKYVLVNLKRYNKDLRELETLRELTATQTAMLHAQGVLLQRDATRALGRKR